MYTYFCDVVVYQRYAVVVATIVAQDVVDLFRQCSDGVGFSIGEVILANELNFVPVLLICHVNYIRIGLLKKYYKILKCEDTDVAPEIDVAEPEFYCSSFSYDLLSHSRQAVLSDAQLKVELDKKTLSCGFC